MVERAKGLEGRSCRTGSVLGQLMALPEKIAGVESVDTRAVTGPGAIGYLWPISIVPELREACANQTSAGEEL